MLWVLISMKDMIIESFYVQEESRYANDLNVTFIRWEWCIDIGSGYKYNKALICMMNLILESFHTMNWDLKL